MNLTEAKKRNSFNHRKKASSATCDYRTEKRAIIRELYLSCDPRAWNLQHRHSDCVNKLMCEIQRFFIFPQNDWKRHLNSLLFLIIKKTFCLWFFWREEINIPAWERCFCFKSCSSIHTSYRCQKPTQHCDCRRATEGSYTHCKYQHM